jgi:aminoglycoside phosphotransferase (APT) family kinase protein
MGVQVMHENELRTDAALVGRLLADQFPQWAHLPIEPVASSGTDNAMYRLGDELAVRLPRLEWDESGPDMQRDWLPKLAPDLPVPVPLPVAVGAPGHGYPMSWSICRWLEGRTPVAGELDDPRGLALDLARFVRALQAIDATDGPGPGDHNNSRGAPLITRDEGTREALVQLRKIPSLAAEFDIDAAETAWEAALRAPAWSAAPVWLHGDLLPGNLLCVDGRLSGVIDFECLGVGDPAIDLAAGWWLFDADARAVFRAALGVDDPTWDRGRGCALSIASIALPYYHVTNPAFANASRYAINQILSEPRALAPRPRRGGSPMPVPWAAGGSMLWPAP